MDFGALAAIGTALATSASSMYTQMRNAKAQMAINDKNIGMQYALNADQIAVAQMNNQTQIDLANTAHQREVQDLRDAGLNPILSAGGRGAATPALSEPSLQAPKGEAYRAENPFSQLGLSARELGRLMSEQYKAEVESTKEQTRSLKIANKLDEVLSRREILETELWQEAMRDLIMHPVERELTKDDVRIGDHDPDYMELMREAIKSQLKNEANENWRNNLRSLTGAVGDAAGSFNSAARGAALLKSMMINRKGR